MLASNYSRYIKYYKGLQGNANYSVNVTSKRRKGVKISQLNVVSINARP